MISRNFSFTKPKKFRRGVAAVEFALLMIPFFLLLLGVMEFGRLLYLWNTVQEVTRRAARQAVVSKFDDKTIEEIQRSAVFRASDGALPAAPEITNAKVVILYLNAEGEPVKNGQRPKDAAENISFCLDAKRVDSCIRFVEVCVSEKADSCAAADRISFVPMISLFSQSGDFSTDLTGLKIPLSTVRMPAESLGLL